MAGVGDTLDGFELVELIGAGGLGRVYRARHPAHEDAVAVKVLEVELSAELLARFRREARFLERLAHPRIVRYLGSRLEGAEPYLAMQLIAGEPMSDHMHDIRTAGESSAFPHARLLSWSRTILEALAHAHGHGIIHRDLKPENILIDHGGDPVLIDFGLGRSSLLDTRSLTRDDQVLGTVRSMSPEQMRGGRVTASSDVYQWGLIVYELATGQLPFESAGPLESLRLRDESAPPLPLAGDSEVTRLVKLAVRCLRPAPEERFSDARQLLDHLLAMEEKFVTATTPGPLAATLPAAAAANALPGDLGGYRIVKRLGRGGMGEVLEGVHPRTGERVAIKVIHSVHGNDPRFAQRFELEIATLVSLLSPRVVRVLGHGDHAGTRYLVMELVPGEPLDRRLASGWRPSLREAIRIVTEITEGLSELHARGLVHRDLKPSNVMVDASGSAKLLDLGLVTGEAATRLTEVGGVVGTIAYMPPEMFRGEEATPAADVYQVGLILYDLVTGRQGARTSDAADVLRARLMREGALSGPPGLALVESLASLYARTTRPEAAERPGDARALLRELRGIGRALEVLGRPSHEHVGAAKSPLPTERFGQVFRGVLTFLVIVATLGTAYFTVMLLPDVLFPPVR